MPSTLTVTNTGAQPIPTGHLAELGADDSKCQLATVGGRPWGIAAADIAAGAQGTLYPNGQRTCFLAPGETVTPQQRLISAGSGRLKGVPANYTGWTVGRYIGAQAVTAPADAPAQILVQVAPRTI